MTDVRHTPSVHYCRSAVPMGGVSLLGPDIQCRLRVALYIVKRNLGLTVERVVEALQPWTPQITRRNLVQASAGVALADSQPGGPWFLL